MRWKGSAIEETAMTGSHQDCVPWHVCTERGDYHLYATSREAAARIVRERTLGREAVYSVTRAAEG